MLSLGVPAIAAEVDDMAMLRLLGRENGGAAVIPPILIPDALASGLPVDCLKLEGHAESFLAMTRDRRFPNPQLSALLEADD